MEERKVNDEDMKEIEQNAVIIDMDGEVCPYPQIIAREEIKKIDSGKIVVIQTDHVMATKAVPQSVSNDVSEYGIWKSGSGQYKIILWKK